MSTAPQILWDQDAPQVKWDEPKPQQPAQPGFFARASERLLGTQHPLDQAALEATELYNHPIDTLTQATKQAAMMPVRLSNELVHHPVDTLVNLTGGKEFAQDVANKNYSGAAGTLAGDVLPIAMSSPELRAAAGKVPEVAGDVATGAKDRLGSALREPGRVRTGFPPTSGALKPIARAIPFTRGIADAIVPENPQVVTRLGRMVPRAAAPAEAAQEALGASMNSGYAPAPPAGGTGATEPAAGEFYENRAQDLMRREAEQRAIDARTAAAQRAQAARTAPTPKLAPAGLSTNPQSIQALPMAELPPAGSYEQPRLVAPQLEAPKPSPLDITTQQAREARPTGSEGRPATWTNEKVLSEAAKGNRFAIEQANRRGLNLPPNTRYVMGDPDLMRAPLNARETTRFTPEGVPIRDFARPESSSRALIEQPRMSSTRLSTQPSAVAPDVEMPAADEAIVLNKPNAGLPKPLEAPKARAPRVKAVPVRQQYRPDIIEEAENQMRGAVSLGDSLPQPGRYFDEYDSPVYAQYQDIKNGERGMGKWRGVGAQKPTIAGQFPWMNDPNINVSRVRAAVERGSGADYERIVGKIAEGITTERAETAASISEDIPVIRDLAGRIAEIDPELAQTLHDVADGKIALAPDKLKAYVQDKIADATAAAQFAREVDDAAAEAEAGSPGVPEVGETPDRPRGGSSPAGSVSQEIPQLGKPAGRLPRKLGH